ncbi:toxin [Chromobacterium haemolyticum]|uniref:Toxin n=1 Tax=Chromobacterium fluminis TaxID=3044269 RepID=A0ABX0L8I3_9NEIS|nr:SpvB/TcaC N-terminal domain-containing protein [Chromobacterium haemolyticum]NHR07246.1 toxin [Chromobacterium haemolyticum]
MQKDTSVAVQSLALPKGGGAIVGLGDNLSPIGPSGMAELTLPLPVSAGRGYAPALMLSYNSGAGNGSFGLGWQLGLMTIQRRTNQGVPRYDGGPEDEFVGPDGEILVSERDAQGKTVTTTVTQYGAKDLGKTYQVTRYFPRIESAFHRIERWQGADGPNNPTGDFWLIHDADGQLHCLGKTAAARIANPARPEQVAEWLIEESVNPVCEHIYYRYVAENDENVKAANETTRDHIANRYLAEVYYGNQTAVADLYLWDTLDASGQGWLFSMVLDYGERGIALDIVPPYAVLSGGVWLLRADSFSRYQYGFELRTHRLCRQVLMFHHFANELQRDHTLVQRLLLTYRESPVVSQLTQVRTLAYEPDNTVQSLPPLEFAHSEFDPRTQAGSHQVFDGVPELNNLTHYQMVDLFGEGLPGVLFRHGTGWRYRPPIRGKADPDEVAYGDWQTLPVVPAMQPVRLALMDIDGDGRLDWLVTQSGISGCFSLREGNQWSGFTPFNALPVEFFHPQAQLADLVGAGLSDLALIGPKSVRLYANQRDGYAKPIDVSYRDDEPGLPIVGRDARELVAFSDMLGSGQPHLVSIRHDGITCWPNLGRGGFGKPFKLAPLDFDWTTFNPDQVFLADLDGSGATDLIYIERDCLTIYLNQSGNSLAVPIRLPLPEGLIFDRLCRVSFADLQGLGVASLVISHPHMVPSHWRLDFARVKPYLIVSVNNNMGASTTFKYRSSAQYWLDDKFADPRLTSALPMPVHTLAQVVTLDEITGNSVTQQYGYHHGVYDGVEREFRGFGLVTAQDAKCIVEADHSIQADAPPLLTKTWYHTGRETDESTLPGSPYHDANAVMVKATRLTRYDTTQKQDVEFDPKGDATTRYWLFRALKGMPLRQEVYGLDGSDKEAIPYSVSTSRYQVRLVQAASGCPAPVVLPSALEQVAYTYERIAVDPMVSQQVQLQRDQYGAVIWQVGINYPRRPKGSSNPYPDSLPSTSWSSSYDDQQTGLILNEQRSAPLHLENPHAWLLGLPFQQRGNVLTYEASQVPSGGLNFELLSQADGLLGPAQPRVYAGQQRIVYTLMWPALVDHVESAEFDDEALKAFDGVLDGTARGDLLKQAGYQLVDRVLSPGSELERQVWIASRGYTDYLPASGFYRPSSQRSSQLTGAVKYGYDGNTCMLTKTTDALGNETVAQYDYRFLQPRHIVDLNANMQEVRLDALGRVVTGWFYGTEGGQEVGFLHGMEYSPTGLTVALAIENAGKARQQVASIQLVDPFSWMGQLTQEVLEPVSGDILSLWSTLQARGFITADGWILSAGHRWATEAVTPPDGLDKLRALIQETARNPVRSAILVADRYPSDPEQQVRVSMTYFDGWGRTLQAVQKVPPGAAWQRDAHGELVVDRDQKPVTVDTPTRWAVSGKVEYNNKGQPVRSYQPYFINDWRYVVDTAMRTCGFADTHFYDATGREVRVVTAKGYVRRTGFYPWFTVMEDENDTWQPTA